MKYPLIKALFISTLTQYEQNYAELINFSGRKRKKEP